MFKTNLYLALRNMKRKKLYTIINIAGLGISSAFCILVFLYVQNENSYDRFHHESDQLFRVEVTNYGSSQNENTKHFTSFLHKDEEQKNLIQTPTALALDLKKNFPEIRNSVRLSGIWIQNIRVGNQVFKPDLSKFTYADSDFFQVFNYPLVYGNVTSILSGRNEAAISEKLAEQYYGKINPVGKTFSFPDEPSRPPITISGVFKDFPENSSFQYDMIFPMESNPDYQERVASGNNTFSDLLILKISKNTNLNLFRRKLDLFAKNYFKSDDEINQKNASLRDAEMTSLFLRPFTESHYNQASGWQHFTDIKNIYQLICLSVIILFLACLNYILLTLSRTVSGSQDVGIRKTIGAGRIQIIIQYYTETQLLAFFAVLAGFFLAITLLPYFNSLTDSSILVSSLSSFKIGFFLLGFAIILGLIAGVYPALIMSGLKPLNIMRDFPTARLNPFVSKFLVIVQFSICVILIISSLVINKQVHYLNKADMGFYKNQVLIVESPYANGGRNVLSLKEKLMNYSTTEPVIADFSTASFNFGRYNNNRFVINGKSVMLEDLNVDYNYFSFLNIPIIKGRTFSKEISSDSSKLIFPNLESQKRTLARHAIVVNETLYKLLRNPELGNVNETMGGIIIGVCKDYHTEDLSKKIQPAYHTVNATLNSNFWFKIKAGQNITDAVDRVRLHYNILTGNMPFTFRFMDDEVTNSYKAYVRWMQIINDASFMAILIACLGLFGLSALTTINRLKEISIRKILGASVTDLFVMLNKETLLLSVSSFLFSFPIGIYLSNKWLENFAYKVNIDWFLFILSGLISLASVILAVSYHTVKASLTNPIKNLNN